MRGLHNGRESANAGFSMGHQIGALATTDHLTGMAALNLGTLVKAFLKSIYVNVDFADDIDILYSTICARFSNVEVMHRPHEYTAPLAPFCSHCEAYGEGTGSHHHEKWYDEYTGLFDCLKSQFK